MLPEESPFTDRPEIKELPYECDGSFGWIAKTPTQDEWVIDRDNRVGNIRDRLNALQASAKAHGFTLPKELVLFLATSELHQHLRSVTACYLDVAETVLPFAGGYLARFLADQQGCAFWYVYSRPDGSDHCVVSSLEYFDGEDMDYEIEELKESDFRIWACSLDAFVCRFWLENEILFAKYESTPPPDVDPRFLALYAS